MAETVIAPIALASDWDTVGVVATMTALDNTNGNKFVASDVMTVIVQNTDSGSHNVQFTSVADSFTGRTGSINQAVAAGVIRAFQFTQNGWSNGGYVFMPSGQSAFLKICILAQS